MCFLNVSENNHNYFNCSLPVRLKLFNFSNSVELQPVAKIADDFDHRTNPHPNPTDFEHEIRIRWLAPSHPLTSYLVNYKNAQRVETSARLPSCSLSKGIFRAKMTTYRRQIW